MALTNDTIRRTGVPRAPRNPIKITDVAAAAGVAAMTVSRVLNTPERVSPATAERVREAIARLGYVPNLVAGGLSSRRSRMVAVVVPTIAHPMFVELVGTFSGAMKQGGYQVMLSLSGYEAESHEDMLLPTILGRRPDALLLTGSDRTESAVRLLRDADVPVVEIFDVSDAPVDMLVGLDHAQIGRTVAGLFWDKGYRHFATFAAADRRARIRCRGFLDAVRERGGDMVTETVLPAPSTIAGGRRAMIELLPALPPRIGLFCSSDLVAYGALTEARLHGVSVPGQLAICGFGNFELSQEGEVPFSTVSVEGQQIGSRAAQLILQRLEGGAAAPRELVEFRIIERTTT